MIVSKFGGTSMGSAQTIQQVATIIRSDKDRRVVVVSAMSGITDALIELGKKAESGASYDQELQQLVDRHEKTIQELDVSLSLDLFFDELKTLLESIAMAGSCEPSQYDHLLTFGERLSSVLLTAYLQKENKVERIDSRELIQTDNLYSKARVDVSATNQRIKGKLVPALENNDIIVVTGFIGSDKDGNYTTLGRGGSDYSAAVLARGLSADRLEIWTDVSGILTTDPRMIPEATSIPTMSFNEAAELAFFGAKVLHPKTIKPAVAENIPVHIRNTFEPEHPGTVIHGDTEETIKSVTYRKDVTIVNVCSTRMLEAKGFLRKLFQVFDDFQVAVDVVSTSEVSVSMTLNELPSDALVAALQEIGTVQVFRDKALICLVGQGIKKHPEVLADLFGSIRGHRVEMISQGASLRNITIVVDAAELKEIVTKIYSAFF